MVLVAAHRGASAIAPENTLEAFEKAIEIGADMVEFDVRATGDGRLVVCHDAVDVDRPGVPRLAEVVEVCAGRISLDVELKQAGLEAETLRAVSGADFVVTSFLPEVVAETKRLRPDVRTGLLLAADAELPAEPAVDFLAPHVTLLDRDLVAGDGFVVWTVNDEERLRRYLADARVAAVITDDPALALRIRAEVAAAL